MSDGALEKGMLKVGLEAPVIVGTVKLTVELAHDPVMVFTVPSV
jgi:hypothetical protein